MFRALIVWLFLHLALVGHASHVMGGEITYKHLGGGNYQFELVFYRDCNGADVNAVSESLRVWNHPTLSVIPVLFVQRQDLSPSCTQVPGGAGPLLCGTGNNGGNGIGAIEKVIYRSAPIALNGNPPAQGWAFTYENFSRSGALTNLANPSTYGMTLVAKIFNLAQPDDSPVFNEDPNFVSCAGLPYQYNAAVSDANLDSLHFEFGVPYDHFPSGVYNPPANPAPIPFVSGFSFASPMPGTAINSSNIPAVLNPLNGNLTFNSFTIGNYVLKIVVKAYRAGILISETEREMQLVLQPCTSNNFPPLIAPPFAAGTSYELTVNAGDLIDVPLLITDPDIQSNGSAQNITLEAQLPCAVGPFPSLNVALPYTAAAQIQAQFTWQTSCSHLLDGQGQAQAQQTYHFVLKATDDVCPIPQIQYATLTIHVLNSGIIAAPEISCIQTAATNELQLFWPSVSAANPGSFAAYQVYSVQNGLLGTVSNINTPNFTVAPINASHSFYFAVASGCAGQYLSYSDTVKNILLTLTNPNNGTAVLNWNKPKAQATAQYNSHYYIYREYPANFFNFLDSVPYNQTTYTDTIDICSAFINYKVLLPTLTCNFTSNLAGDNLSDMLTPYMPVLSSVGFDTSSQQLQVQWNVNAAPDTYGYVVYTYDANGFLIELDTVYGQNNTTYLHSVPLNGGPYTYTVAAFDSCFTANNPPSFQTSAKANLHTSIQASYVIDMCPQLGKLTWSRYLGSGVQDYEIWSKHNNTWTLLQSTTDTSASVSLLKNESYCLYVKANLANGVEAFSNPLCFTMPQPTPPSFHYFRVASVNDEDIELTAWIDASVGITEVQFERKDTNGVYEPIGASGVSNNSAYFLDDDVDTQWGPRTYRTVYLDSCGNTGNYANENTTIFVEGSADQYNMINSLSWTPYTQFDGGIANYQVFRNAYGTWETIPFQILPDGNYTLTDDVSQLRNKGEVCYKVMALENLNQYGLIDSSYSNEFCLAYAPLMFVPNAFTPDGLNPIFLPVVQNVDPEKYTFSIIDRWGKIVFETNDPAAGWDGTISSSGLPATNDVFQYRIELIINKTDAIVKQGYVTLIR
ncbi:MAG: gliding motility-associated C-terminal domain-containing protein [Crocinitomicaceae bacterium]|nr:gliding motility-associated C-terminal domain-containing protein [Crocinitomicaceae bacterium]